MEIKIQSCTYPVVGIPETPEGPWNTLPKYDHCKWTVGIYGHQQVSLDTFLYKEIRGWAPFSPIPNSWKDVVAYWAPSWAVRCPFFAKVWPLHLNSWDLWAPKGVIGCIVFQGFWFCLFSKAHSQSENKYGPLSGPFWGGARVHSGSQHGVVIFQPLRMGP